MTLLLMSGAIIRRTQIARSIGAGDGGEPCSIVDESSGMPPTRALSADTDFDLIEDKPPPPLAPAAATTAIPATPATTFIPATPARDRTVLSTPATVPHAPTPVAAVPPIVNTPLKGSVMPPLPPTAASPVRGVDTPPPTPSAIPTWRGFEDESREDEGPSAVQRRGELRRSRRANKGTKPENIADTYANERENAWRKKHGFKIYQLVRDGVNYIYALEEEDFSFKAATSTDTPTFEEGMSSADADKWEQAMRVELANLIKRRTWTAAVLPPGRKPVGCKWVFRIKRNFNRSINKYKARLTAKGYSQIFGIDFDETFAPTIRVDTWRTMFACAAEYGTAATLFQWDVIGAYLWADLDEEIYMECPIGVTLPPGMDCLRLWKALYGLKQAGRLWYQLLKKVLLDEGFRCTEEDACMFVHESVDGKTMLGIHVDDLFGWTIELDFLLRLRQRLDDEFELMDSGKPNFLLGIHLERNDQTGAIKLHQEKYIIDMLERFDMFNCHPVRSPADHSVILEADDGSELLDKSVPYREAVGALLYAAVNTRPSLAFAVSRVAKFVEAPRKSHWTAVKRIMRFLKGTLKNGIMYQRSNGKPKLTVFCDADYAADVDSRKSTSGYVVFVAGGPVAWRSASQKGTALSTCVAELYALTDATVHTIWHRNLLASLGYRQEEATDVFEDNRAAIQVCVNDMMTRRIKCVGVRLSFLRDQIQGSIVNLLNIPSADNTADIFTKALAVPLHEFHNRNLETE